MAVFQLGEEFYLRANLPKSYNQKGIPLVTTPERDVQVLCVLASVSEDDVACDVGCGLGGFCIEAAKRGAHAIGLDIREDCLERARKDALRAGVADKCSFQTCDFTTPEFQIPEAATVIFMALVPWALELLEPAALRAMQRGVRVLTFRYHFPTLQSQSGTRDGSYCYYWLSKLPRRNLLHPSQRFSSRFSRDPTAECLQPEGETASSADLQGGQGSASPTDVLLDATLLEAHVARVDQAFLLFLKMQGHAVPLSRGAI